MGLVDDLGDFQQALETAAGLAGIPAKAEWMRAHRGLLERVIGRVGVTAFEAVEARIADALVPGVYFLPPR